MRWRWCHVSGKTERKREREGERGGGVTGGLGFQCRRLLKGTGVPLSATRGHWVVRGEPGLAGPNLSLPKLSLQREITCQDLPTLSLPCAVWRLCCVKTVRVWLHACAPLSFNPLVCVWAHVHVVYARTCFYVVDGTAGSRRRSAIVNRNTDLRVCLWKTKQSVVFLSYAPVLASQRKRVRSVLTQHMRFADICSATEASSTSLKHISPLCGWTPGLNGCTVGAERPALSH